MQTPPGIEPLEPRIAPANVIATLHGGVLQIVPIDASAEAGFALRQTGGDSFDFLNSISDAEPLMHFTGVKAIHATLTALEDDVAISLHGELPAFRGSITVNGGAGSGLGNDQLWLGGGGVLAGALTFKTNGLGSVELGNASAIRGKTTIAAVGGVAEIYSDLGSLSATGFSNLFFGDSSEIRGVVKITAPPQVEMFVTASGPNTHFHRSLTVIGSSGNDYVEVRGIVDGHLNLRLGDGDNSFLLGWGVSGFPATTLGGFLNYQGGSGADDVRIGAEVILGSAIRMHAGGGENSFELLSPGDLRSLIYRGGAGHDVFTLGEEGGERLRARVYLGGGNDEATVRASEVLDLRIDGGANGEDPDEMDILRAVADIAGMTARRFESVLIIP